MKNKNVAGILALLAGMFGVHRFYLGQKGLGVLYFIAFFFGIMITAASDGDAPLLLAPVAIGLMDAVLFFVMPQDDFDEKYNTKRKRTPQERRFQREGYAKKPVRQRPPVKKVIEDPYKRIGIEKFREFDYLGSIEAFQKSLQQNYESPSTHFNLACAYSMLELPKDAFFHLEKAVEFGFDAFAACGGARGMRTASGAWDLWILVEILADMECLDVAAARAEAFRVVPELELFGK